MKDSHHNSYAQSENGDFIHITEAPISGRNGYFCPACHNELQAVKPKLRIQPYFRHDPKLVKHTGKCTYSDETYRHRISKEILQRIKEIKVPALYKFAPDGIDGRPNKLKDAQFIRAHLASPEVQFFEDDTGEIIWGKRSYKGEKHLVLKPDVTFFNNKKEPILFIELVATNKVRPEKLAKLKRLSIDTIQVRLPKSTPEDIEKSFRRTSNTQWVYNNEEATTEYIPIPSDDNSELFEIDEEQKRLFEETFECRASEIRNLVRTINTCLESKYYRTVEHRIRREISRIEKATRANSNEWSILQEKLREGVDSKYREKRRKVTSEANLLDDRYTELEDRYFKKARALEREQAAVENDIRSKIEGLAENGEPFEDRRANIRRRREEIRLETTRIEGRREEIDKSLREGSAEGPKNIQSIRIRFERDQERLIQRFKADTELERRRIREFRKDQEEQPKHLESAQSKIEEEESESLRKAIRQIERRDSKGDIKLPERFYQLLQAKGILNNITERISTFKRINSARDEFKTRAYKNWYRP
ncbi:MAG: hypothetical protein RIC80_00455 [Cyclobacteriaceae bacterium]